jgi:hypothetical protein
MAGAGSDQTGWGSQAESCTGPAGTAKSAGIVMAQMVAGFVAGGTQIDTTEAVDMS